MKRPGQVLVVDDEPFYREMLTEELTADGWIVHAVADREAAMDALERESWSVVLVDQKLRGAKGPDAGLELVAEVRRTIPEARTIMITAYASPDTVERAYQDGAYDFVEKTESFTSLLRIKVRNAMEGVRTQWLEAVRSGGSSSMLQALWAEARRESSSARKGRVLEDLLELLLTQVSGFVIAARQHSPDEELDLVVRNESSDPIWSKESPYLLVECKNWSTRVGSSEVDRFCGKLRRRYARAKLGFFVAINGFTEGVQTQVLTQREGDLLMVLVTGKELEQLVTAPDVGEALKELHQRAVVGRPVGRGR